MLLFVLLAGGTVQAAGDRAAEQFQAGQVAFEAGDYATALRAFEAAVASGMAGPAVHFNIGVAAYRGGRYERADEAFRQVARTPQMAALAHYNLGLVALGRNDRAAAERWFALAAQETSDERLLGLAARQLDMLRPESAERNWLGYAMFDAGHDDNVALVASADIPGASNVADNFAELQLAFSAPLDRAWRLDAGLFYIGYQDLDTFNQWGLQGAGRYRIELGQWTNDVGLQLAYSTIDDEGFENKRALFFESRRQLREAVELRARYRFSDIEGLGDFDGLSGERHELGASVNWKLDSWRIDAGYEFEASDYRDDGLSAKRHQLDVDVRRVLSSVWEVAAEVAQRYSEYDLDSNGTENRTQFALSLRRALTERWRLICRYAYADNNATVSEFDYDRNRVTLGVDAVF